MIKREEREKKNRRVGVKKKDGKHQCGRVSGSYTSCVMFCFIKSDSLKCVDLAPRYMTDLLDKNTHKKRRIHLTF